MTSSGRLGYWKAIGASDSVISWIGYGVPMRFVKQPPYRVFPHHRCDDEGLAKYIRDDFVGNIRTGCFTPAPKG